MTVKQMQWQLFFLGYYGDSEHDIDSIFGPKSDAATLAFQEEFFPDPIAHDGIFGDSTAAKSMEVIDQIQDILQSVVPDLTDDGLAGPSTMAALAIWQEINDLPATGRVNDVTWDMLMLEVPKRQQQDEQALEQNTGDQTDTFWDGIRYFKREEFRCKCGSRYCNGFPAEPKKQLVELLDTARSYFGRTMHIISGLRCSTWNSIQGGVANSQHMYGEAADVRIDRVTADELLAFFQSQPGARYAYKINSTNVHVDVPKGAR